MIFTVYSLIKEDTLNYRGLNIMIYTVYSLIKGYSGISGRV